MEAAERRFHFDDWHRSQKEFADRFFGKGGFRHYLRLTQIGVDQACSPSACVTRR